MDEWDVVDDWIEARERLPDVGRRIEVRIPFVDAITGLRQSTTGIVRASLEDPQSVRRFAPDSHPKAHDSTKSKWGFYLTQGKVAGRGELYSYCSENCWRYIDSPPETGSSKKLAKVLDKHDSTITKEQSMSLYASSIRRKDGYQAAIFRKSEGRTDRQPITDTIAWEGETVHVDDELNEEGDVVASSHDKATKEAQAVLDASMEVYIAAGADIVKGKAKKAAK